MSTAFKVASAQYAGAQFGLGENISPFVAEDDLQTAWDFLDFSRWKEGFVGSQTLVAYDQSSGSQVAGDAQFSQSLDGLGLSLTQYAFALSASTLPKFPNNTGVGQTMMAMGASDRVVPGGTTYEVWFSIGWRSSTAGLALGVQRQVTLDQLMAVVENSVPHSFFLIPRGDRANIMFLRANGNSTWSLVIPNLRFDVTLTDTDLSVGDPPQLDAVAPNPGKISIGNALPASAAHRSPTNVYQAAVWNRALTNAEIEAQYQRARLRFPGVLF